MRILSLLVESYEYSGDNECTRLPWPYCMNGTGTIKVGKM